MMVYSVTEQQRLQEIGPSLKKWTDIFFVGTVALGLFINSNYYGLLPVFVILRNPGIRFPLSSLSVLVTSMLAICVVSLTARGTVPPLEWIKLAGFNLLIPILLYLYKPDDRTIQLLAILVAFTAFLDASLNVFTAATGLELIPTKHLDDREGLLSSSRAGGLFGHSFMSGAISFTAITMHLFRHGTSKIALAILPLINLVLVGSYRFTIILLLVIFLHIWKSRSYFREIIFIILASASVVFLTFITSSLYSSSFLPINPSNTFRVFAWLNSIYNISQSPLYGWGFSNLDIEGISYEAIVLNNVAESWYLHWALNLGLPFLILYTITLIVIRRIHGNSPVGSVVMPIIFIDLVYGGVFETAFYFIVFWTITIVTESKLFSGANKVID